MLKYYTLKGKEPVLCKDLAELGQLKPVDYRVALTDIPSVKILTTLGKLFRSKFFEPVQVSTVFLHIDCNYGTGKPELFETMVFGGEYDEHQWRYATWDEALKGHWEVVGKAKGRVKEKDEADGS